MTRIWPTNPPIALGRSQGDLSTKIHALTDTSCCPLTLLLSPGQSGDTPYLAPLLEAHRAHDTEAFRLLADKAYSHPSTRKYLRKRKISHTIPERSDQKEHRKAKGSKGGRPPAFGKSRYRERGRTRLRSPQTCHRHPLRQVRHHLPPTSVAYS